MLKTIKSLNMLVLLLFASVLCVRGNLLLAQEVEKCPEDAQACLNSMAANLRNRGWVGIELDHDEATDSLTVRKVVPGSPAEKAGFAVGDELRAMNDIEYSEKNRPALKEAYRGMTPGATIVYTVERSGRRVPVRVTLSDLPGAIMAQWIGQHMLDYHAQGGQPEPSS